MNLTEMNFICILLHMLICWFSKMAIASATAGQCKAASYSVQDHVLINHVINAAPAELIEHCISRCIRHLGCHSSNFYRKSRWCELNDKTHASHPEDMRQVPFTNYMENTLRPLTCNNDSDCGSTLICFLLKCEGELEFGDQLILLGYATEFLSSFSSTEPESGTARTCGEPDLHSSRGLNCGGGKCRGRTGEGGRGSTPNSGRFYPYPLLFWPQVISSFLAPSYFELEAERPLFKKSYAIRRSHCGW